jgi:hypothetical protein
MRTLAQKIETVPVEELREHPRNPNRNELPPLIDSIERVGFYGAIIAQRSTGHILVGNHRYRAAVAAGMREVPVVYVDVDDVEASRIMLADNRTAETGEFDQEALDRLLSVWDLDEGSGERNEDEDGEAGETEVSKTTIGETNRRPVPPDAPEGARRVVALAYDEAQYEVVTTAIQTLCDRYGTDNTAQAVLRYLREASDGGA